MGAQNKQFQWQQHPQAENFLLKITNDFAGRNNDIASLERRLKTATSTRLFDWVDHLVIENSIQARSNLEELGFLPDRGSPLASYSHPGVMLPAVVLVSPTDKAPIGIALRVEHIPDFLQCNRLGGDIEGDFLAPFRKCLVSVQDSTALYVVERRGTKTFQPSIMPEGYQAEYLKSLEMWQTRPRGLASDDEMFDHMLKTANQIVGHMDKNMAAHIICEGERRYWMSRNHVAGIQKMRQDRLGMGWANHDHHTFRSSRQHFTRLVELFTILGFQKRERFYAGREAGWGAQVMENPVAGLSLFLDVDLAPEEVEVDFSTIALPQREDLGTVGLWCALHGDSILKAGMHHLAAHFLFNQLPLDLSPQNIEFMAPFSDFDYLKQSFSKGEIWQVDQETVQTLIADKTITTEKGDKFLSSGVIGSHLENIQRREGYKGFNKKNVNVIIRGTDPRIYQ